MASHYLATDRNQSLKQSDAVQGTSSTAGSQIELRVLDGAGVRRKDVLEALERFEAWLTDTKFTTWLE
jgi:hypothetical protein